VAPAYPLLEHGKVGIHLTTETCGMVVLMQANSNSEPDYRMTLAAERTYLAYVRTALALLAGGVAVVGALPDAGQLELRRATGIVLVLAGLLVAVTARSRWRQVDAAMRRGEPLPRSRLGTPIAVAMVLAAALALVIVVLI
jgi:putative membrane protein